MRSVGAAMRLAGWKKFALAGVVIVGLVYIFGHRKDSIVPHEMPCEFACPCSGCLAHL